METPESVTGIPKQTLLHLKSKTIMYCYTLLITMNKKIPQKARQRV